jgi:hypothetical protein
LKFQLGKSDNVRYVVGRTAYCAVLIVSSVTVFAVHPLPGLRVNLRTWSDDLSIVLTVRHVRSELKHS